MATKVGLAPRLGHLEGAKIALLDCGKRGGSEILKAIGQDLTSHHRTRTSMHQKSSAHRMASRKLVGELAGEYDAVVYGVVN